MASDLFKYAYRVHLADTDAAGVVYFAKGLEFCHAAYEESLEQSGISINQMLREGEIALPIVHAEIDWFCPIYCSDRLEISLTTRLISSSEFAIAYQISKADDLGSLGGLDNLDNLDNLQQILVKAQTRHVCIDPARQERADLPTNMIDWLEQTK